MNVLLADAMGFCFGVRDALAAANAVANPERVTIQGELVHNPAVTAKLIERGFQIAGEAQRHEVPSTPAVLITAHGTSHVQRRRLAAAGKQLLDTTCPLVRRAHLAARSLAHEGRHVLVIGQPGHVEVLGLTEDLSSCDVVAVPGHVRHYAHDRLGVVCQTTTPPHLADEVLRAIRDRNPQADVRFVDTICQPTRERQQALAQLLERVDAMVIVGGRKSNNTRQLVELCRERRVPAHHVESAGELDRGWFHGCRTVGLTAGTSTPDAVIAEVERALRAIDGMDCAP